MHPHGTRDRLPPNLNRVAREVLSAWDGPERVRIDTITPDSVSVAMTSGDVPPSRVAHHSVMDFDGAPAILLSLGATTHVGWGLSETAAGKVDDTTNATMRPGDMLIVAGPPLGCFFGATPVRTDDPDQGQEQIVMVWLTKYVPETTDLPDPL